MFERTDLIDERVGQGILAGFDMQLVAAQKRVEQQAILCGRNVGFGFRRCWTLGGPGRVGSSAAQIVK